MNENELQNRLNENEPQNRQNENELQNPHTDTEIYGALAENLLDMVTEEQAKLGYRKETIRFYYPLRSLQNITHRETDENKMAEFLSGFPAFMKERYGTALVTHKNGRFCFCLSEDVTDYVHQHTKPDEFIVRLISLISSHDTTMEKIEALFDSAGDSYEKETLTDDDFDLAFHFISSKDRYYYCFKDEGIHITYHRFLPEDYRDLFR